MSTWARKEFIDWASATLRGKLFQPLMVVGKKEFGDSLLQMSGLYTSDGDGPSFDRLWDVDADIWEPVRMYAGSAGWFEIFLLVNRN